MEREIKWIHYQKIRCLFSAQTNAFIYYSVEFSILFHLKIALLFLLRSFYSKKKIRREKKREKKKKKHNYILIKPNDA